MYVTAANQLPLFPLSLSFSHGIVYKCSILYWPITINTVHKVQLFEAKFNFFTRSLEKPLEMVPSLPRCYSGDVGAGAYELRHCGSQHPTKICRKISLVTLTQLLPVHMFEYWFNHAVCSVAGCLAVLSSTFCYLNSI